MTDSNDATSSILGSIKKSLNIPDGIAVFDPDLIMLINTTFAKLNQMGIGPSEPFSINDETATWDQFSEKGLDAMVKTYMYLEVRLVFDPPTASVLTSMEKKRDELEWRLNVADDELLHVTDEQDGDADDDA